MLTFPIIYLLISLLMIDTILYGFKGMKKNKTKFENHMKVVHGYTFPIFLEIGFILSGGLYITTFMKDRFDGLRYILNFTGIKSSAYILGLQFADLIMCLMTILGSILVGNVLGLETFKKHSGEICFAMICFSFPYI